MAGRHGAANVLRLLRRFDTNVDGRLSFPEFAGVASSLLLDTRPPEPPPVSAQQRAPVHGVGASTLHPPTRAHLLATLARAQQEYHASEAEPEAEPEEDEAAHGPPKSVTMSVQPPADAWLPLWATNRKNCRRFLPTPSVLEWVPVPSCDLGLESPRLSWDPLLHSLRLQAGALGRLDYGSSTGGSPGSFRDADGVLASVRAFVDSECRRGFGKLG